MNQQAPFHYIAESLMGSIAWQTPTVGAVACPGQALHTHPHGSKDCLVYLEGAPTIFCLHSSCASVVSEANQRLRSAIGKMVATGKRPMSNRMLHNARQQREAERQAEKQRNSQLKNHLSRVVKQLAIEPESFAASSPSLVPQDVSKHWHSLLSLFEPQDVLWCGEKQDSGSPSSARCFKVRDEWLKEPWSPGPLTTPCTFQPGSISRSKQSVLHRRFLVVESDVLPKPEFLAVVRWLSTCHELRAVVDTGGKSLHAWFNSPPEAGLSGLKETLVAMQCDEAMFRLAQPVRLPSFQRPETKRMQRLIWVNMEVSR